MRRVRLLLVEDSAEDRRIYQRLLRGDSACEYEFAEAWSGEEALRALEEVEPDCVVIDYQLPDMNGAELLQLVRRVVAPERCPALLMLTGRGDEAIAVEAMKAGAHDYLRKSALTAETLKLRAGVDGAEDVSSPIAASRPSRWEGVTLGFIDVVT